MRSSTIRKGFKDSEKSLKNKRRVSSLVLKIYSKVNSIKRSKRTAYKELKFLKNYKALIGTPPVYYI